MADTKISGLPASTVPLAGTEVLPIVQSSTTKQVSVANLTAGRAVDTLNLSTSGSTSTTPVLGFNASNCNIASGATVSGSYLQNLLQNKSGTAGASTNYVLSNDLGTDSTYYGEFGMNSSVFSASTPADYFSINNGIYFSGHDGDVSYGSGNGFKTYLAWGTTGQSAHVINATGALGFSTNLGTTPALSGTTGFGTSGQALISAGSAAAPAWGTLGVAGGGTGLTTLTANYIPYGNGTSAFQSTSSFTFNGTTLQILAGSTIKASTFSSTNTATFSGNGLNTGRIQLSGAGGTSYSNGIQFSQGGSSELWFGQVQDSSGYGAFYWQGYTVAGYRNRMSLSSTGQLSIVSQSTTAYTGTGANATGATLLLNGVNGATYINGIEFSSGGSNENYFGIVQEAGGSGAFVFQGYNGAAYIERMRVFSTGGVSIGNTTDPGVKNLSVSGTVLTGGYTVATLPTAGTVGRRAYVTDALAPTYLGALVGGGAVKCPVFDNGTAWVSA